ncbi:MULTISPECIES: glycosyltransferase family 4 protein [Sorangium]|uniref:glycosyltransferase family 4 protein n=1 Tax=Sorangium TaxID=39643 RepID=UPI003D9C3215
MKLAAVFLVALTASWAAVRALVPFLRKTGLMDVPNARSSHAAPTPRGGGAGLLAGAAAAAVAAALLGLPVAKVELFIAVALMAFVGFLDDRSGGLSVRLRLGLQVVAAGIVVLRAGGLGRLPLPPPLDVETGIFAYPIAVVWLVGVLNIYNFLDGIDGFAGVQGVIAALALAFLGGGATPLLAMGLAVAGACAGFLAHNWHPAKVFMGDVGSAALGLMLAALPFELDPAARGPAVFAAALSLWFFLADGTFTMGRRLMRGEKIWEAHRSHLYQRLVRTGLTHAEVARTVGVAAALVAGAACAAHRSGSAALSWGALLLALALFVLYAKWTSSREARLGQALRAVRGQDARD